MSRTVSREMSEMSQSMLDIFLTGVDTKIREQIALSSEVAINDIETYLENLRAEIAELRGSVITVVTPRGSKDIAGARHKCFEPLVKTLSTGFPLMLVGPAGSGKTYAAEQAATALDVPFYAISVGLQTSKSDLLGYMNGHGAYVDTAFRQSYEKGGLFLMDEIDAGNPNVLIVLNSALAGTSCSFPDKMVQKHNDFYFVSTANTYGSGASRQYVGRNQLDAATIDRFIAFDWPIDEALEHTLIENHPQGTKWHTVVRKIREFVDTKNWRIVVSPRATLKGAQLLALDFSIQEVIDMTLLTTAADNQREPIKNEALKHWRN